MQSKEIYQKMGVPICVVPRNADAVCFYPGFKEIATTVLPEDLMAICPVEYTTYYPARRHNGSDAKYLVDAQKDGKDLIFCAEYDGPGKSTEHVHPEIRSSDDPEKIIGIFEEYEGKYNTENIRIGNETLTEKGKVVFPGEEHPVSTTGPAILVIRMKGAALVPPDQVHIPIANKEEVVVFSI